jgi:hypothetical protein
MTIPQISIFNKIMQSIQVEELTDQNNIIFILILSLSVVLIQLVSKNVKNMFILSLVTKYDIVSVRPPGFDISDHKLEFAEGLITDQGNMFFILSFLLVLSLVVQFYSKASPIHKVIALLLLSILTVFL